MINRKSDKILLENLVSKYGKNELVDIVKKYQTNEAFGSNIIRDMKRRHEEHNKAVKKDAFDERNRRINALNRYSYGKDDAARDEIGTYNRGWIKDKEGNLDRREYDRAAQDIQRDALDKIRKGKVDDIINFLSNGKYSSGTKVQWDKVTDDDITFYSKDNISKVRKFINNGNYYVIFINNNDFAVAYSNGLGSIRNCAYSYGRRHGEVKFIDIKEDPRIKGAYVIDISNLSTYDMRAERSNRQYGRLENTPEQNAQIAKNNIERYKKIIASNNISQFDKVDTDVKATFKAMLEKMAEYNLNSEDYREISNVQYKINNLSKLINELLENYRWFASYRNDLKNKSGYSSVDNIKDSVLSYRRRVYEVINKFNEME